MKDDLDDFYFTEKWEDNKYKPKYSDQLCGDVRPGDSGMTCEGYPYHLDYHFAFDAEFYRKTWSSRGA